jgi:hypothetical protein
VEEVVTHSKWVELLLNLEIIVKEVDHIIRMEEEAEEAHLPMLVTHLGLVPLAREPPQLGNLAAGRSD